MKCKTTKKEEFKITLFHIQEQFHHYSNNQQQPYFQAQLRKVYLNKLYNKIRLRNRTRIVNKPMCFSC